MLRDQVNDALKEAMRAQDKTRVSTLRLVLAAIKDRDIQARTENGGAGIEDADILQIFAKMVKQRIESADIYGKNDREDLQKNELDEIAVIETFMPRQMSEAEIQDATKTAVAEIGASTLKDMGKTMAILKERYAGQMDFAKAGAAVKALLS